MPFTTSHPAIILPLKKLFPNWFSLSGLIAGAMSPDLLYFLEMTTVNRSDSHSWNGLLFICLPVGVIFCFAFHWLVKYELIVHLPSRLSEHLSGLAESQWKLNTIRQWLVLIVSVLIGAMSHLFWDSFTHLNGVMVGLIPVLKTEVSFLGEIVPWSHIFQHISTVAGAVAIFIFFSFRSNLPNRVEIKNRKSVKSKIMFWIVVALFAGCFALLVLKLYKTFAPEMIPSEMTILGLSSWAGFFYFICGYTLIKRLCKRE